MKQHNLTWGDRGHGMYWQARCCNFSTIGNGGPYATADEAKEAAMKGCEDSKRPEEAEQTNNFDATFSALQNALREVE